MGICLILWFENTEWVCANVSTPVYVWACVCVCVCVCPACAISLGKGFLTAEAETLLTQNTSLGGLIT